MTKIDFTKPEKLMRRDGGAFEIYNAERRHGAFLYTEGDWVLCMWDDDGRFEFDPEESCFDLIPSPEPVKEWPQDGDTVYYVASEGSVRSYKRFCPGSAVDKAMLNFGALFRTRQNAERAAAEIKKLLARINVDGECKL